MGCWNCSLIDGAQKMLMWVYFLAVGIAGWVPHASAFSPMHELRHNLSGQLVADAAKSKAGSKMQRVIVTLKGIGAGPAAVAAIAAAQDRLLADLKRQGHAVVVERKYSMTPQLALAASSKAISALRRRSDVSSVQADGLSAPQ
jgi:hypothetical protein